MDYFFKDIQIDNFRGFDHLLMKEFSRVNVIVGANNVGKSTVLEALFMLSGMSLPILATRINRIRSCATGSSLDESRYFFHNTDFSKELMLQAHLTNGDRKLSIVPHLQTDGETSNTETKRASIKQLTFKYGSHLDAEWAGEASLYVGADGALKQTVDGHYKEPMGSLYIPADKNDSSTISHYATLVKRGKKQDVLDAIQLLFPEVQTIEALPDGMYLSLKGINELLPISMAGDGIRRVLNITSSVATEDYNVVLIDELDNGLHYTAHKTLWGALLQYAKINEIQIFVTTHNLECLQSLNAAASEMASLQELIAVYDIAKTKNNGFQAYRYNYAGLKEAIDNEIEIRR